MSLEEQLMEINSNNSTIANNCVSIYNKGFSDGKKSEYDAFWDVYQDYGNRTVYVQAFARQGWINDATYMPKYDIVGGTFGLQETFTNASSLVDTKVNLIVRSDGLQTTFNGCTRLVRIPSLILEVPVTKMSLAFNVCHNLEEINISCVGDGCIAASFDILYSKKLNKQSWINIINALSSTTSGLNITGSLVSVKKAFETSEGVNDGDTSPEWLNLIATKSNWGISLL